MYSEDAAAVVAKIPGNQDSSTDYFGGETEVSEAFGEYDEESLSVNDKFLNVDRTNFGRKLMVPEMDDDSDGDRFAASQLFTDVLKDFVKSNGRNIPDSSFLQRLAEGIDSLTRINVLDHINDVFVSFFRFGQKENAHRLTTAILPSVLKFLTDEIGEVRTKSSLLISSLMHYDLDKTIIEKEICPAVVEVSDIYPPIGIDLMGKLAFYLDEETVEKLLLEKFMNLCSSDHVYTREFCAENFGNMCDGLGKNTTEKKLLPVFIELCRDSNQVVRIACAENFMAVTCICSLETRKNVLAPVFADLLVDPSQFVRVLSYRILGAFICTFADPSISGLQFKKNGEIKFVSREGFHFSFRSPKKDEISNYLLSHRFRTAEDDPGDYEREHKPPLALFFEQNRLYKEFKMREFKEGSLKEKVIIMKEDPENNSSGGDTIAESKDEESGCNNSEDISSSSDDSDKKVDDAYNTFRFWRTPLLDPDLLDLEPEQDEIGTNLNILDNELTKLSDKLAECSTKSNLEEIKTESVISSASTPDSGWNSASTTPPKSNVFGDSLKENNLSDILYGKRSDGKDDDSHRRGNSVYVHSQEVVPQLLLDYFVSMTEPFQAEKTDEEIAQHCAYFLPAVALTLGPENWMFLRKAYKYLAADFQWKVRKTVASSIYELASILGEDVASKDLVPIFRGFLRDLDEVRIGALEHLADFLKFLDLDTRNMLLPLLKEFLKTDNDRNWRYREELGEQLRLSINLFSPVDCLKHLAPITTCLLCDKVAAVRQKAINLMSDLIVYLSDESHFQIALLDHLVEEFAENPIWRQRQVFVLLCSELARQNVLDCETFATMMLGHLLKLSNDSIPNIGLCVARCLSHDIINSGYISPDSLHYKSIAEALESLKENKDSDVRYYAGAQEEEEQGDTSSSWETMNYSSFPAEYQIADSTTESTNSSESFENSPFAPAAST